MKPVLPLLSVALALGCSSGGGGNGGNGGNMAPVARVGPDQAVDVGTTVALDGRESHDADGDTLSYRWAFEATPAGSAAVIAGSDAVRPAFVPDKAGTYRVRLLVNDGKADSDPAVTQVTAVAGALLAGDPASRALDALTDVPPLAVDPGQIESGVIMTRLDVRLRLDATVGQVNDALSQVGARIVTMWPGLPTITVSVPRPADLRSLQAVAQTLRQAPGIRFASLARVSRPRLAPTDDTTFLEDLDYLRPTRFPAAWNAKGIAVSHCAQSRVPVLVADDFIRPDDIFGANPLLMALHTAYALGFPAEVPRFIALPAGETGESTHGYDVTTTLGARFDVPHPTGANPLPECLTFAGIRLGAVSSAQGLQRIAREVGYFPPSERFVLSYAQGYLDACVGPCDAATVGGVLESPLARAFDAVDWKLLTHSRWADFLVATAAGNERNEQSTAIYPGMGVARYTSEISMATLADPYLASIEAPQLWSASSMFPGYPSLAASAAEAAGLADHVRALGMDAIGGADNVLVTGATTEAAQVEDLAELGLSDGGPDVKAVGEGVFTLATPLTTPRPKVAGTSFSAPQVAGLASYLWLLSPDLRSRPAQVTRQAILANARGNANTDGIIDAYASVLSLDEAVAPTPGTAPIRLAILDVDESGLFDESDVELYLRQYFDTSGNPRETDDCGRFDLNGDCFTGGTHRERFDLDREGSTQYGATILATVRSSIMTPLIEFDERALTDLQVLCYYAYSGLYSGDAAARDDRLRDRCAALTAQLAFPSSVPSGGSVTLVVSVGYLLPDDEVQPAGGIDVSMTVGGGAAEASTGTTDPAGGFSTVVRHDGSSSAITITLTATDADGRQATRSASATVPTGATSLTAAAAAYAHCLTEREGEYRTQATGWLTTTAPVGPVTQVAGPVSVALSTPRDGCLPEGRISLEATAQAAAQADYGTLRTSGSGQTSVVVQNAGNCDYPIGGATQYGSLPRAEAIDRWTITPDDAALQGRIGTMLLDVDVVEVGDPPRSPPYDGSTYVRISYGPAVPGYSNWDSWYVPPGGGTWTFALAFRFGESLMFALSLETDVGGTFSGPPDWAEAYSWSNSVTASGIRIFQGLPDEGGARVTGFRVSAESGHDYGFGHQ